MEPAFYCNPTVKEEKWERINPSIFKHEGKSMGCNNTSPTGKLSTTPPGNVSVNYPQFHMIVCPQRTPTISH
jgi:hypothetical protein